MRILIAYDGSPCAKAALFDLRRAGLPKDTSAKVLSVADVRIPPKQLAAAKRANPYISYLPPDYAFAFEKALRSGRKAVDDARRFADAAVRRLEHDFPDWTVQADTLTGSPAQSILDKAEAWRTDLIVLGSRGRMSKLILGSVSQNVLHHASCGVRIARGEVKEKISPVRLVIAVDGSEHSQRAVDAVADRRWASGSAAHLVTVADARLLTAVTFGPSFNPWVRKSDKEPLEWVGRMMNEHEAKLTAAGLVVSSLIKMGDVRDTLLQEAARWGADCIFAGTRGLGAAERWVLGSTSTALAARAHCSVEIFRE